MAATRILTPDCVRAEILNELGGMTHLSQEMNDWLKSLGITHDEQCEKQRDLENRNFGYWSGSTSDWVNRIPVISSPRAQFRASDSVNAWAANAKDLDAEVTEEDWATCPF